MGLFSAGFTKPGPGVSKNAPQKRRVIVFFEVFFRKFWKLLQLNFLFVAACIPIIALFFAFNLLLESISQPNLLTQILSFLPLSLISLPLVGLVYVCRNYAREEHAFLLHDFFDQIKKNWKLGLLHGVVSYFVFYLAFFACNFYFHQTGRGLLWAVPGIIAIILLFLFFLMQYYVYLLMVTFDLSYRNILKNAAIFSIAGFLRNICLSLFTVPVWGIIFICFLGPVFESEIEGAGGLLMLPIPFVVLGLCSFTCFLVSFVAYPLISKYMIEPVYKKAENTDEEYTPREGDHYQPIQEKKEGEYVFENGRLVKRLDDVEQIFDDAPKD